MALQLADRRRATGPQSIRSPGGASPPPGGDAATLVLEPIQDLSQLRVYKWRAGTAAYARAWKAWGAKAWAGLASSVPGEMKAWIESKGVIVAPLVSVGQCDVWCASFSSDVLGGELKLARDSLRLANPRVVMADFPRISPVRVLMADLEKEGFSTLLEVSTSSTCGDPVARSRSLLLGVRGCRFPKSDGKTTVLFDRVWQCSHPVGMGPAVLHPTRVPLDVWLGPKDGEFTQNPAMRTTGDRKLPWPRGCF